MTAKASDLNSHAHRIDALHAYEHQLDQFGSADHLWNTGAKPAAFSELTLTIVALGLDVWTAVR